jgi:hypothetical protein
MKSDDAAPTIRYIHEYFEDDDRDLYYELNPEGYAARNIDVNASTGLAEAAVRRNEWNQARDYGDLYEYMAKYGGVVEGNIAEGLDAGPPFRELDSQAFEEVWDRCRRFREELWDSGGRDTYEREKGSKPRWTPLKA